jgi:hypothetical protein
MAQPARWERDLNRRYYLAYLREQRVTDAQLARVLRDASREAEASIVRILDRPGIGAEVRRQQYQMSSAVLRDTVSGLWSEVEEYTRAGMARTSALAVDAQARHAAFLAEVARVEGIPVEVLRRNLEVAARGSVEHARSRLLSQRPLSPLVYKNADLAAGRVDRLVNQGIATGRSAKEIAGSVRHLIRPDTRGGVSYAAMRLGRTELGNAFHTTTIRGAAEMPFVEGFKWELSGSHPRPDDCDDLHDFDHDGLGNGVFRPENVPDRPHPNCMCYTITVTVRPSDFEDALLRGDYDDWLSQYGDDWDDQAFDLAG